MGYSGVGSAGWEPHWDRVKAEVQNGFPVATLVDTGALGGTAFAAHWPVVYRITDSSVYFTNWRSQGADLYAFLDAWKCWFLPLGFNTCYVTCRH